MTAAHKTLAIAGSSIGLKEITGNQGFEDKWFEEKMKERGFKPGDAWCALFVEYVLWETYKDTPHADLINQLCSKSAVQTWQNFKKDRTFRCDKYPVEGAVVIWQKFIAGVAKWQGHAGIVSEITNNGFYAIEGNGNASGGRDGIEVVYKWRTFSVPDTGLRILGFIYPLNINVK